MEYLDLSPFPPNIHPTHQKVLVVNLGLHAFTAYDEKGQLVHWGPVFRDGKNGVLTWDGNATGGREL